MKGMKKMNKLVEWKERLKKGHMFSIIVVLLIVVAILGMILYKKQREYRQASENSYNMAFYELVDYVQNVETYLAKSLISTTPEHGAETLTNLWREANLAQKDLANLEELHSYSTELENTLNQLSEDLNSGRFEWGELTKKGTVAFAQQVDNISKESFSNLEENFHEYSGLIYDGAYSEHMTSTEKKGLTGEDIDENTAKELVEEFIGKEKIKEISSLGLSENASIPAYTFSITGNNDENINISISQNGGHVVYMNTNREVNAEILSQEEATQKGKEFLENRGFHNMQETYYITQEGITTINYAYKQGDVIVYPDLIKVKVALDNGEILGIETTGYLNNHTERNIYNIQITSERAKENLNPKLELVSEGMAIIPTEWQTEILCYEFKGKVNDKEFLVYINAENGREEDILIITDTGNGVLTM